MLWMLALIVAVSPAEGSPESVLATQVAAWNRGDLPAFCASYAADAVFLSPTGLAKGREALLARYRKRYPDRAAMGTLQLEPLEVRHFGDGASVVARWTLTYPDKPAATGLTLLVLGRKEPRAAWELLQDASM